MQLIDYVITYTIENNEKATKYTKKYYTVLCAYLLIVPGVSSCYTRPQFQHWPKNTDS